MIADGLKAAMPHARAVSVDLATIRFTDPANGRRYIYLTPIPAQVALLEFDQGRKPDPFTVKVHAAQIVEPKRKPVKKEANSSLSETPDGQPSSSLSETPSEQPKRTLRRATLIPNPAGGGTVPIKLGGNAPPLGPLARGMGTGGTAPHYRTGRKRGFGLRVMGH
jgi:hypothetical protein